jgi:hypothetical protein
LTDGDKKNCINRAVSVYSERRPYIKTVEGTGDGTRNSDVPSDWDTNFSRIESLEYPLAQTPRNFIRVKDRKINRGPSGMQIEWLGAEYPSDGDGYYLTYTIKHTVSETASTVYSSDEEAVVVKAAQFACEAISAHYNRSADSSVDLDAVDHRSKADQFRTLGTEYKTDFDEMIPDRGDGVFGDWDQESTLNTEKIFHTGDRR